MTDQGDISGFWAKGDTLGRILDALDKAGLSLDTLSIHDLAPVDHLHARGLPATVDLADRLPIEPGQHILDIGCAVGGPARYMAERFGCRVSGIDITPGFIEAGEELNRLTGMVDRVDLRVGDGATLPYENSLFDGAYTQHVTMNVADRAAFFAEAFRVIKPGGFFALSEHGIGPKGDAIMVHAKKYFANILLLYVPLIKKYLNMSTATGTCSPRSRWTGRRFWVCTS
jgi:SAM-dependent methyltransferase